MSPRFRRIQLAHWLRLVLCLAVLAPLAVSAQAYEPTPENLAAREKFQDAKFGVFIHWGVYSVLGRGEWVMNNEKITVTDYEPLAERFNPTEFDADEWCRLFKEAGAEYITITSKHHDGFAMWDSKVSDWDIVERTPYKKDVLKQLAEACRKHGLKLFFYHSHLDWRHPEYFPVGQTGRTAGRPESGDFDKYLDYMDAQLAELLGGEYGDVAGIWFDGWWDQQSKRFEDTKDAAVTDTRIDWRLKQTYDLIHRLQPAALVGNNHHVAPFAGEDFQMFERDLPGQNAGGHSADSVIGDLPLETCDTINGAWGYNAGDTGHKSVEQLVTYLVRSAGLNANLLLNVGPKPDGTIDDVSAERLRGMGEWLKQYGETIYGTRGGPVTAQEWGVTTKKPGVVYVHVLKAPAADAEGWTSLSGAGELADRSLKFFGADNEVESRAGADGALLVRLPAAADGTIDRVLVASGE